MWITNISDNFSLSCIGKPFFKGFTKTVIAREITEVFSSKMSCLFLSTKRGDKYTSYSVYAVLNKCSVKDKNIVQLYVYTNV